MWHVSAGNSIWVVYLQAWFESEKLWVARHDIQLYQWKKYSNCSPWQWPQVVFVGHWVLIQSLWCVDIMHVVPLSYQKGETIAPTEIGSDNLNWITPMHKPLLLWTSGQFVSMEPLGQHLNSDFYSTSLKYIITILRHSRKEKHKRCKNSNENYKVLTVFAVSSQGSKQCSMEQWNNLVFFFNVLPIWSLSKIGA